MESFTEFKNFLRKERRSKIRTIDYHVKTLRRIYNRVGTLDDPQKFKEHLDWLCDQGYKPTYINDHTCTMRVWGQFKNIAGFDKIAFYDEPEANKATMSDHEIEAFLNMKPKRNGPKESVNYQRWTLFFSIMAFTGMRPGEVAHLEIDDVDFGRSVFTLLEDKTKTNTSRNVPIPPNVSDELKQHIDALTGQYLFPSRRGGDKDGTGPVVDNVDWHYNFHTRIKRLGIRRRNLTPYSLRHSFITQMLEEDVNLFKVQKIVGHRQISTTAHYTHLTTKDINNALKKHPLVRKHTTPNEVIKSITEHVESYGLYLDKRYDYSVVQQGMSFFWKSIQEKQEKDVKNVLVLIEDFIYSLDLEKDKRVDFQKVEQAVNLLQQSFTLVE